MKPTVAHSYPQLPTVCLCMIVKDEARIVLRCLGAALGSFDTFAICDTGSTDGTLDLVANFMLQHGIGGMLQERPWVNFAHNRNEALDLAKGLADFVLLLDADDILQERIQRSDLSYDRVDGSYQRQDGYSVRRPLVVRSKLGWRWEGLVHEYLSRKNVLHTVAPQTVIVRDMADSHRNRDPEKYQKDVAILQAAFDKDPSTRTCFYLAQSYRDAGDLPQAYLYYNKRSMMGGWVEEVWYSLFQCACLLERMKAPRAEIVRAYERAQDFRPERAEAWYECARFLRQRGEPEAAYPYAVKARDTARPNDKLFLDEECYQHKAWAEATCLENMLRARGNLPAS